MITPKDKFGRSHQRQLAAGRFSREGGMADSIAGKNQGRWMVSVNPRFGFSLPGNRNNR
jgi:hypothetical protein